MADEITREDRELLAAEYERVGLGRLAALLRDGFEPGSEYSTALRAIAAARRQGQVPSGGEVVAKHWHEAMVRDAYSRGQVDGAKRAAPPSAPVGVEDAVRYDAGLLSDYGGGNVEWWQDYIRAELDRAHDYYTEALAQQPPTDVGIPTSPPAGAQAQGGGEPYCYVLAGMRETVTGEVNFLCNRERKTDADLPLYTAPPSAPVGVEGLVAMAIAQGKRLQWPAVMDTLEQLQALAQQPAAVSPSASLVQTALLKLPQYISKSHLIGPDKHSAMQCFEVLRDALAAQQERAP